MCSLAYSRLRLRVIDRPPPVIEVIKKRIWQRKGTNAILTVFVQKNIQVDIVHFSRIRAATVTERGGTYRLLDLLEQRIKLEVLWQFKATIPCRIHKEVQSFVFHSKLICFLLSAQPFSNRNLDREILTAHCFRILKILPPPYATIQSASLPVADEMERPILYIFRPADLNSSA